MASGVPVVVSPEAGARVGIADGINGFHARGMEAFSHSVARLLEDRNLQHEMSLAARDFACARAWDGVFDDVYRTYQTGLKMINGVKPVFTEVPVAR